MDHDNHSFVPAAMFSICSAVVMSCMLMQREFQDQSVTERSVETAACHGYLAALGQIYPHLMPIHRQLWLKLLAPKATNFWPGDSVDVAILATAL